MDRRILMGVQDFSDFKKDNSFYIDKTGFIREWQDIKENAGTVNLILHPRWFDKTLLLSTVEQFFSTRYANRSDLFEGLDIWKDEKFR